MTEPPFMQEHCKKTRSENLHSCSLAVPLPPDTPSLSVECKCRCTGCMIAVAVEQAKTEKDWTNFCKCGQPLVRSSFRMGMPFDCRCGRTYPAFTFNAYLLLERIDQLEERLSRVEQVLKMIHGSGAVEVLGQMLAHVPNKSG